MNTSTTKGREIEERGEKKRERDRTMPHPHYSN
jgi:hypothetical protein